MHDVFGHAALGVGFDLQSEYAAWLQCRVLFSEAARPAAFCELVGAVTAYVSTGVKPGLRAKVAPVGWMWVSVAALKRLTEGEGSGVCAALREHRLRAPRGTTRSGVPLSVKVRATDSSWGATLVRRPPADLAETNTRGEGGDEQSVAWERTFVHDPLC